MKCPVCNRNLAPSLSICLTCGTMMNDSVREELQTKVASVAKPLRPERPAAQPIMKKPVRPEVMPPVQRPRPAKVITTELETAKTSKTLVEFQTKNATLPDWRLQVQNAVRQRSDGHRRNDGASESSEAIYQKHLVTNGANALKPERAPETEPAEAALHCDPRVANALKRIAESRKTFLHEEASAPAKPVDSRNYPFNIVSRSSPSVPKPSDGKASINVLPKPKLVSTYKIEKKKFDTNKLPPLPAELEDQPVPEPIERKERIADESAIPMPDILPVQDYAAETEIEDTAIETDEIDDLAPFALRFNAGLFDMIIGVFASLILLSPLVFLGGNWFSLPGIFALVAACSIVMFIYLTVSVGLWGKTIGMRIFSLELVDAEENEYPTFHQAAVNAAVYLAMLPLFGAGFLTVLFNEERRAAHDLASGTIVVTEF